jgi:hypothetical protein
MILSDPFPFALKGKSALLRVVRNNGHCWGEIRCGAERHRIDSRLDLYERTDEQAANVLIAAAKRRPDSLAPSLLCS